MWSFISIPSQSRFPKARGEHLVYTSIQVLIHHCPRTILHERIGDHFLQQRSVMCNTRSSMDPDNLISLFRRVFDRHAVAQDDVLSFHPIRHAPREAHCASKCSMPRVPPPATETHSEVKTHSSAKWPPQKSPTALNTSSKGHSRSWS
jgi:hypothetical protein